MLLLLDIPDNETANSIQKLLKEKHGAVKAELLSQTEAEALQELKEIIHAKELAHDIEAGKITGRSVHDFLNEL